MVTEPYYTLIYFEVPLQTKFFLSSYCLVYFVIYRFILYSDLIENEFLSLDSWKTTLGMALMTLWGSEILRPSKIWFTSSLVSKLNNSKLVNQPT